MKSFKRTWNTPSRILTPLVAQGMNSKRWLASGVEAVGGIVMSGRGGSRRPRLKHALFTSYFEDSTHFLCVFW